MKQFLITVFLGWGAVQLGAQGLLQVYPGDVTNNGVVNNLDFLHLGLAYNYAGPARDSSDLNFAPKAAQPWSFQFPGGLNMAYADCNGDGFVNYYYDAFPLYTHYGAQRDSNIMQDVFVAGLDGIDPALHFDPAAVPTQVFGGQTLRLPIVFGTANLPVEDLYGVAFSITIDPQAINPGQITLNFSENSWANPDGDRIWMWKKAAGNRVDVGWVRTDQNQKRGYGQIGYADFVIVVDVIPAQQLVPIVIERVKMMDKFGNYATVAGDTVWLNVMPEGLSTGNNEQNQIALNLFPNPAHDRLLVETEENIEALRLLDLTGRVVFEDRKYLGTHADLQMLRLPAGVYLLEVSTAKGTARKKVYIE